MHAVTIYCRSSTASSAAIRLAQLWRPWAHSADLIPGTTDVAESLALRGGVVRTPLQDLLSRTSQVVAVAWPITDAQAVDDAQWLRAQIGTGYDYLGAAGAAWLRIRKWQSEDRWWCSELSAARQQRLGLLRLSPYVTGVMPTQGCDLAIAAGAVPVRMAPLLLGQVVPQ